MIDSELERLLKMTDAAMDALVRISKCVEAIDARLAALEELPLGTRCPECGAALYAEPACIGSYDAQYRCECSYTHPLPPKHELRKEEKL